MSSYIIDLKGWNEMISQGNQSSDQIPIAFSLNNFNQFMINLLIATSSQSLHYQTQIQSQSALALWNSGHFSEGLSNQAVALEMLLKNLDKKSVRTNMKDVIFSFNKMVKFSVENNLEPALKFIELIGDKLTLLYGYPLVQYVFWIHLSHSDKKELQSLGSELIKRYESIENIRQKNLEQKLLSTEFADSGVLSAIKQYLANLNPDCQTKPEPKEAQNIEEQKVTPESEVEDKVNPEILSEILEIKVLEHLQSDDIDGAIDIIAKETTAEVSISEVVLVNLLQNLGKSKSNKAQIFQTLKESLPLESPAMNRMVQFETNLNLKHNYLELWNKGFRQEAIERLMRVYNVLLEEDYLVTNDVLNGLLKTVRLLKYLN